MSQPHQAIKIDSFKLRIELAKLSTINLPSSLNKEIIVIYADTGEIAPLSELSIKPTVRNLKLSNDGGITSINVAIESIRARNQQQPYLTLKITAKLLKSRYYDGITVETLPLIAEYLNSVGVQLSIEQLLSSQITDIDFCRDLIIEPQRYIELIEYFKRNTIATIQQNRGLNIFNRADNRGVEFSKREKATPSNPYLKLYNKYLDSYSGKHGEFFNAYDLETCEDLHRVEFTLKDSKHFKHHGILSNTLRTFLNLTHQQLLKILGSITEHHINKPTNSREIIVRKNQNMNEHTLQLLLQYGSIANIPFETTKERILFAIESRTSRARHEKIINRIHQELQTTSTPYDNEVKFAELLKELCLV